MGLCAGLHVRHLSKVGMLDEIRTELLMVPVLPMFAPLFFFVHKSIFFFVDRPPVFCCAQIDSFLLIVCFHFLRLPCLRRRNSLVPIPP